MSDPLSRLNAALRDRYRIERELGAGGMATVYLAEDLKHDRKVAIKVLRPELAAVVGAERFLAEIKTTANLRHPHILPLFDSGEADGLLWYAMPHVEGESLRERLTREKQLPVDEAVAIVRKVAGALQAAHDAGVIHRDIKPANILLENGEPVVADFGIALAVQEAGGGRLTETGLSLGTPYYMSPEQATGDRDPDARSDVYALGVVLYEMLTGEPPFQGKTAQVIVGRILSTDPVPPSETRRSIPANVEAAVLTALEKTPADRFGSAAEFAHALGDAAFGRDRSPTAHGMSGGSLWSRLAVVAVVTALVTLGLGRILWSQGGAERAATSAQSYTFVAKDRSQRAIAVFGPDGSIWYTDWTRDEAGNPDFRNQRNQVFFVRRPGSTEATEVAVVGRIPDQQFVVSPDGTRLAFFEQSEIDRSLTILDLDTKDRTVLTTVSDGFPEVTEWTASGALHYTITAPQRADLTREVRAWSISVGEGVPTPVELPVEPGQVGGYVQTIPGTDILLYTEHSASSRDSLIQAVALDTRSGQRVVVGQGRIPTWSPTGHVLFVGDDHVLRAVAFDPDRLEVTGPVRRLLDHVRLRGANRTFALAADGTFAYSEDRLGARADLDSELAWIDASGEVGRIAIPPMSFPQAELSPRGDGIVYVRERGRIWVHDLLGGADRPLGEGDLAAIGSRPIWSPDGDQILFGSGPSGSEGGPGLYIQDADGSTPARRVASTPSLPTPTDWHRDGVILFSVELPRPGTTGRQRDIFRIDPATSDAPEPILEGPWQEQSAVRSPNGEWVAFRQEQDGRFDIYVRRFPEMDREIRVSDVDEAVVRDIGRATWSRDGQSVRYQTGEGIVSVRLEFSDSARVASREVIATGMGTDASNVHDIFAQHPGDGRWLADVVARGLEDVAEPRLMVMTNFFDVIRDRMAEGN